MIKKLGAKNVIDERFEPLPESTLGTGVKAMASVATALLQK